MPVTALYSLLLSELSNLEAALDTVVDTRCIADNEGRSLVSFCFCECLDELVLVRSHGYLSNVYVTIAHSHHTEILLLNVLTTSSELSNSTLRCGLGSLSACVGVNLCIENENVNILTCSENVVKSAVTDIVSPSVTTDDPL